MAEEDFYTMWGQWATQTCQKLKTIRKLEEENKKLKKEMQELKEKTDPDYAAFLIAEFKIEMGKLELKKNAYKKDFKRYAICLDAALTFVCYNQEKQFSKESLYTLWLEEKAHQRNLELARDRERLAGSWLQEGEMLSIHLRERFLVCDYCKRRYIISHLHDDLSLPHRERQDYFFCHDCLKGACRKCEDKEVCRECEYFCRSCCKCPEEEDD